MIGRVPPEIIEAIERLGAQSNGDVPALIAAARATAESPFRDDALLAQAIEEAAVRRGAAGDRGASWWLACAVATLRSSPIASAQEDAEIVAARVLNELARSPAAVGPLPPGARWIVAGQSEPIAAAETIELARKNATTYIERLDAELAGRASSLKSRASSRNDAVSAAIEEALATYTVAIITTRAALSRVIDQLVGRSGDPNFARNGATALAELDDVVIPALRSRIDDVRQAMTSPPAVDAAFAERPSFAGAAPPAFRPGDAPEPPRVSQPENAPQNSIDDLDRAMRAAFERAWASPEPSNLAAFEQAVRARYEVETASMPDPEARQKALDHYVAHAMSQLPAR
jgi:hypothetical protein